MNQIPRRKFWPYDEVNASRDLNAGARFILTAPWLTFQFDVDANDADKAEQITQKLSAGLITPADLDDLNWLFSSLASYPFAYILPRPTSFGTDQHEVLAPQLILTTPQKMLLDIAKNSIPADSLKHVTENSLSPDWTWDLEASLEFSKTETGYDPETLFSVARRFHLLNDLESNKTTELLAYMSTLEKNSAEFRENSALIMRQNHYVTEQCERVLSAALPLSQSAGSAVSKFMQAEKGHDNILKKALRSLGTDAQQVPVIDCVVVLMELFQLIAERNLLAFSMVVDIFERTSYRKEDPFAELLVKGGEADAASQIEIHREINDAGGHENVAIEFLKDMCPVNKDYAVESLRLCELLTQVIHSISKDTLAQIRARSLHTHF